MAQSLATMASTHGMMPLYSVGRNGPYHRSMHNQSYPHLDTKSAYSQPDGKPGYAPEWSATYGEDTSPIDDYSFDNSVAYLPACTTPAGSNMCGSSDRWTQPTARQTQSTTSYYPDYDQAYITNGLPYLQNDLRSAVVTEPVSPLNMTSLQLTLPEGPHQRQIEPMEGPITSTRRRLPKPQPNPGHGLHHALDQQQGQRLRSSQTIATPSFSNVTSCVSGSFVKPLLPWAAANENLIDAVNKASTSLAMPPPATPVALLNATDASSDLSPPGTSSADAVNATDDAPKAELSFGTLPFLDPSTMTAPTPPAYSNFRESHDLSALSTALAQKGPSSSLYTFDGSSRRSSCPDNPSSGTLVGGRQYTPLSQPSDPPNLESLTRDAFDSRNVPSYRTSMSNLNNSF